MMHRPLPRLLVALCLAAGAAAGAGAQGRPPAMPTRDVVVDYKVDNTPPTVDTVAWLVAEGRIRTDGKALVNRVAHLIDTRADNVTVLVDAERTYHDLGRTVAAMTRDILPARTDAELAKEGPDTVADHACTVWRIAPEAGSGPDEARRACITADGVPLRLVEGQGAEAETLYEATRVVYGPQEPARFRRPADYKPLEAPASPRRR